MITNNLINIEDHNCTECYRCVRACRVKAIRVKDGRVSIIDELCTRCGACAQVCPHEMISLRDDIRLVRQLMREEAPVVASVHPSWVSEFGGLDSARFVEGLRLLGFSHVSDSLLGKQRYDMAVVEHMQVRSDYSISTECPVTVRLIQQRYPDLASSLVPLVPPAVIHAMLIRRWFGQSVRVVHITPCVAIKDDSAHAGIDSVLTFSELRQWIQSEGINLEELHSDAHHYHFEPYEPTYRANRLLEQNYITPCADSGFDSMTHLLASLRADGELCRSIFLDIYGCQGGCLNGAGATDHCSAIRKKLSKRPVLSDDVSATYLFPLVHPRAEYVDSLVPLNEEVAASQLEAALRSIGKFRPVDYHNCNACGYESCVDFARAMVQGKSEKQMCMSYGKILAQKKFSALLGKMPSAVILADSHLRVVEANRTAADVLGADAQLIYDVNEGMGGADLMQLISFAPLLSNVMAWGRDVLDDEIQIGDRMYRVSIFSIEAGQLVCVVINNIMSSGVLGDELVLRTRAVIRDNLESVQKIAYILGETASRTEAMLNSIVEGATGR